MTGAEFRIENYRIEAGEAASWQLGNGGTRPGIDFDTTSTGTPKNPGAQVFPGFQPSNEVNRFRNSVSGYAGLEIQATDRFLVDAAGRFERYDHVGNRLTGKLAAFEPFAREGVGAAQFFANAVDTRTNGVDIVAAHETPAGDGTLTLEGALNLTDTEVQRINVSQAVANTFTGGDLDAVRNTIFNREERNRLEDALPRVRGSLSARYGIGRFTVGGRASYFGSIEYKPADDPPFPNDEAFGAKVLFDLDLGYDVQRGVRLSVGGNNILNTFPDKHRQESNDSSGQFPFSRRVTQFGMNGGFYYARLQRTL